MEITKMLYANTDFAFFLSFNFSFTE